MRDILPDLDRWRVEQKRIALATVVQTWGSAPRRAGSKMAVTSDGQFSGSVSGGCVENAVIESALECLQTGQPRLLHFGVADETAWEVGLACGGSIDIFVQPLNETFFPYLRTAWMNENPSIHATVIRGPANMLGQESLIREDGTFIGDEVDPGEIARELFLQAKSKRMMLGDETELFLEFIAPPPMLIAVGGVHITVALMSLAKTLGYRTVIVDPRSVWGNEDRFPNVDQLIASWPEEAFQQIGITSSTAVVMLTHDPKLDDPAIKAALNSSAFYIGALGSKVTNEKRRQRLLSEGITEEQLSRLHAPVGLPIQAETPEEIALAIMAEVVETAHRREQNKSTPEHQQSQVSNY